jgi:hypothetical protein
MQETTLPLDGLSSVRGKPVIARFDGGMLSSNTGVLALGEIERRLRIADRLAACIEDPRDPTRIIHGLAEMIGFRMKMIAAGYEDLNDACALRRDPVFKMAEGVLPSDGELASQATLCRLENGPGVRELLAMGRAFVDLYCASFKAPPKRIVLDIDDTFDAVHGGQQLRLFNAHYDEYGFQPIVVFDEAGRFVAAVLRPAKRPNGAEIRAHLRRLLRLIRANWPHTRILIRADSHYASPLVIDWCRANGVDFVLGLAPSAPLRRRVETLEASTHARFEASTKTAKIRRFKDFYHAADSWTRAERVVARVEVGPQGADTRFVVTSLTRGRTKTIYEELYCARGQAENHIKAFKTHLAADRTSCTKATANQFRLFLHAGAYWLLWSLRAALPKRSRFAVAQFDTLRLRVIKIAARVIEMKTQIRVSLPSSCPDEPLMRLLLQRIPRLVT